MKTKILIIIFIFLLNIPLVSSKENFNISNIKLTNNHFVKEQIVQVTNDDVLIMKTEIHYKNENNSSINFNFISETQPLSTCFIILPTIAEGAKSYVINPTTSNGLSEDFVLNAISTSAETWDASTTQEIFNSYSIDKTAAPSIYNYFPGTNNRIAFGDLGYYGSTALAITRSWYYSSPGKIVAFDIIINGNFNWGDAILNGSVYDLQSTITHEFGHTFGLADLYNSPCSQETMFGYGGKGEISARTLNDGDIAGLQIIYPSIPNPTPTATLTPTPTATPTPTPIPSPTLTSGTKGDVNSDGQVSVVDALFIAQYTVGVRTLTSTQLVAADVNGDGQVTIVDAMFMAQYTVGLRIL